MKFHVSLKNELIFSVIVIVAVSSIPMAVCLYNAYKDTIRDNLKASMSDCVKRVASNLESEDGRAAFLKDFRNKVYLSEGGGIAGIAVYNEKVEKIDEKIDSKFRQRDVFKQAPSSPFCEFIKVGDLMYMRQCVYLQSGPLMESAVRWSVAVAGSCASMNKKLEHFLYISIIAVLLVLCIGILMALLLAKFLLSPINNLIVGASRIAEGDLSYKVPIFSTVELSSLSNSFNTMSQKLKQNINGLTQDRANLLDIKIELEEKNKNLGDMLIKIQSMQNELLREERVVTMGRLAASVAHELNNPLTSLRNISYFLSKTESFKNERSKKMLELLELDVARASGIIGELLYFSKIDNPRKSLEYIDEIIDDSIEKVNLPKNVIVSKNLERFEVFVDRDKIRRVVVNFVTNARDAMPKGGSLFISAKKENGMAEIKIKDNGVGIKDSDKCRLFEPLFTTKLRGIGIGLCITKEIIDLHMGSISVDSTEGVGTEFVVVIPIS
jgi:signal transduction histidine kinase